MSWNGIGLLDTAVLPGAQLMGAVLDSRGGGTISLSRQAEANRGAKWPATTKFTSIASAVALAEMKAAAKALKQHQIILIDRANHHLFQPLLYQVATAALTPSQIATPIRSILRKQKNVTVILGEVTGMDKERRRVFVSNADRESVPVAYDYLICCFSVRPRAIRS